jgi:multiple sugar transport system substrate-binding protein
MIRRVLFTRGSVAAGAAGAAGAAVSPLVACAPAERSAPAAPAVVAPAAPAGPLTFMHYRAADEQPVIKGMVDRFVAVHHGVGVTVVAEPNDFDVKLQVLFAAGTPPDVYYSKPESYGFYVRGGQMAGLTPLITRDRYDLSDFFPGSVGQYQIGGQTYALPRGYAPNTFYVNPELFRQAGAPLPATDWKDTSWTWARLIEAGSQLTKRSGDDVAQYAIAAPLDFRNYATYVYSNGGELWDRAGGESRITQPPTVETLQFIADLMHKYRIAPTPAELKQQSQSARWTSHGLAMTHDSASRFGEWQRAGLDFDVAVPPLGAAPGRTIAGGGVAYSLAAGSKQRDAAWELLKWMTGKEMQLVEVQPGIVFPPRRSIASSPAFLKPGQPPAHAALTVEAAESHMLVTPPFTRWQDLLALMDGQLATLWNGQDSARSVAGKIQPQVDALLKESPTPS